MLYDKFWDQMKEESKELKNTISDDYICKFITFCYFQSFFFFFLIFNFVCTLAMKSIGVLMLSCAIIFVNTLTQPWLPKIIWTYWAQPIKDTDYLYRCLYQNHLQYTEGWQIRHLNRQTAWVWLSQIPNFKQQFGQQFVQKQVQAKKADLIRLALVHHFGGIWIDFGTIMITHIDWVLNLKNNSLVKNKYGEKPDVFFFYSSQHGDYIFDSDVETGKSFLLYPAVQVFFIAAVPKAEYLGIWYRYFYQALKNGYKKYKEDNTHSWLLDYAQKHNLKVGGFLTDGNYFDCSVSNVVLLQHIQRRLDKKWIRSGVGYRELAVKKYKIWTMPVGQDGYRIHDHTIFSAKPTVNIFAQSDIEYLKSVYLFPRYMVIMYHNLRQQLFNYLIPLNSTQQYKCIDSYYILQNSIIYKYLLSHVKPFYKNKIFNQSINHNCIKPELAIKYEQAQQNLKCQQELNKLKDQLSGYQNRSNVMKKQQQQRRALLEQRVINLENQLIGTEIYNEIMKYVITCLEGFSILLTFFILIKPCRACLKIFKCCR